MLSTLARRHVPAALLCLASLLTACGGGDEEPAVETPPPPPPAGTASISVSPSTLSLIAGTTSTAIVTLTRSSDFTGDVALSVSGAASGVSVTAPPIAAGATTSTVTVTVAEDTESGTATLTISGTGAGVTTAPVTLALAVTALESVAQIGDMILNEGQGLGHAMAFSADGSRVAIGSPRYYERFNLPTTGRVRVFEKRDGAWVPLGQSLVGTDKSLFGRSLAMSADGNRLVVGASGDTGRTDGGTGQVFIYEWNGLAWGQTGVLGSEDAYDRFGTSVSLSADGKRLVAGATRLDGGQGYASTWDDSSDGWVPRGRITGTGGYGQSVAMSGDGRRMAVGAPYAPTGEVGSVHTYQWDAALSAWQSTGTVPGLSSTEWFGYAIALSGDGSVLAAGAPRYDLRLGITDTAPGQVRIFRHEGSAWAQRGASITGNVTVDASGAGGRNPAQFIGMSVGLSFDGNRVVTSGSQVACVGRVLDWLAGGWVQKTPDIGPIDKDMAAAISPDGLTVAISTTVFLDRADRSLPTSGTEVRLYAVRR